ncbi:AraC family transcriptional regulator [Acetobacter oeni]|uniref:Transcriptional regulator n=1 Tax=Acetobacter oeni TaxID=304077 RepID=A0A511XNF2_9PROT|nr:AraC family transcriptional regulator [Acetobacter oeni]MBB3884342.1 AraC-like DNA-binding protein [Acetobacter oeni]NHO20306.1 helix-turn-helix domain-containing protein [Acetobacter oeni]GBR05261.1 AraC family transcriptional regulator [Acetobacter oeni LMG 21952]GEN64480.1 transcriptional regulator [Acetobacter oeni]
MSDPLGEIVSLLRPRITFTKIASGAGPWRLRKESDGHLFYCAVVTGGCRLQVDGHEALTLGLNDFVLMPAAENFTMNSLHPGVEDMKLSEPNRLANGEYWLGTSGQSANVRTLVGQCTFASPDAALLLSLMPDVVHVKGEQRLATLVALLGEEARAGKPAQNVVLAHLLEVMLIEAFRSSAEIGVSPGLLRGLTDERLAIAIRRMHQSPGRNWTINELAREAGLSRSSFFAQFSRAVGVSPMAYLLHWRMALAREHLRRGDSTVAEVAVRVGYRSASSFSVAFARHVGMPPAHYARQVVNDFVV